MKAINQFIFLLIFFALTQSINAQTNSLVLKGITKISLTRQGQILASDESSNIFLIDSTGKTLYQYSPKRPAKIHLLEAWNGLRPFAFYRDFQEFVVLDRFLLADGATGLDPEKLGYARLVAPSQDGNLWVWDESNFQLGKIELGTQKPLFSTPLDLILNAKQYEISFMREYQNQLYVCDRKNFVLQFDLMGNFKKKLPLKESNWVGIANDEIYTISSDSIIFFNPYKLTVKKLALPQDIHPKDQLIFQGKNIWWVEDKGLMLRKP